MNKLFGVLGLMMMAGSIPAFAQNVGVGYKADGSDVSGDFAEAEGDGASVSADVTVGFNIGKKIAIAIKQPDGSFTTNPLFHPTAGEFNHTTIPGSVFWAEEDGDSGSNRPFLSENVYIVHGGIYSNTDVSITFDMGEFINEDDPSSRVSVSKAANMYTKDYTTLIRLENGNDHSNPDPNISVLPVTMNVGVDEFASNGGVLGFGVGGFLFLETLDANDRSGNYYNTVSITVTAM